ncbi:MAG TPA: hypothetical protein VIH99_13270 [Bdellovibrionota bacterium]
MREPGRKNSGRDERAKALWLAFWLVVMIAASVSAHAARKITGSSTAPAPNAPLNQADTQILSRQINDKGSDESLRASTTYAMQALMDLAGGHLPGAVKNGYSAYGKYRNSENLDNLKDENAYLAASMASVGSGPTKELVDTDTTFRRLDPAFLRQGEAAKVAAEFERQTGMKREDFLTQMAEVSEKKIKRSDPMMIDKALARFEGFLAKIPNQEFRKNAQKSINMVPDTIRRGMVGKAVQKLAGFFADAGSAASSMNLALDSNLNNASGAESSRLPASAPAAVSAVAGGTEPQSGSDAKPEGEIPSTATAQPMTAADSVQKSAFDGVVVAALATTRERPAAPAVQAEPNALESGDLTIFQQVTKRYRILTPLISQLPR